MVMIDSEDVLYYIFKFCDLPTLCAAAVSNSVFNGYINNTDYYKSASIFINKKIHSKRPIIRQVYRCFQRRSADFVKDDITMRRYGSKYIFWNKILNEPLRMWSPRVNNGLKKNFPNKYVVEWDSKKINHMVMNDFIRIYEYYLPSIMLATIEDCEYVRKIGFYNTLGRTTIRACVPKTKQLSGSILGKR